MDTGGMLVVKIFLSSSAEVFRKGRTYSWGTISHRSVPVVSQDQAPFTYETAWHILVCLTPSSWLVAPLELMWANCRGLALTVVHLGLFLTFWMPTLQRFRHVSEPPPPACKMTLNHLQVVYYHSFLELPVPAPNQPAWQQKLFELSCLTSLCSASWIAGKEPPAMSSGLLLGRSSFSSSWRTWKRSFGLSLNFSFYPKPGQVQLAQLGEEQLCRGHEIQPEVCPAIAPGMLMLGSVYNVSARLHKQPVSFVVSPEIMLQWVRLQVHLAWHSALNPE